MARSMERRQYAQVYGPTTGDRVRLGDTSLVAEVEEDLTSYGDECVFGGGKVLRDGMGQAAGVAAACVYLASDEAAYITEATPPMTPRQEGEIRTADQIIFAIPPGIDLAINIGELLIQIERIDDVIGILKQILQILLCVFDFSGALSDFQFEVFAV